jgi:ribosome biogenesis GTP-binding protein YsxC/EngB
LKSKEEKTLGERRGQISPLGELTPEEAAKLEWEALEKAAEEAGSAFEEALAAKLEGWKKLKAEGVLDKIDETFTEDDIREMDELSEQLLKRRINTKSKQHKEQGNDHSNGFTIHGVDPSHLTREFSSLSGDRDVTRGDRVYREYSEKLRRVGDNKSGTSSAVMNLLNELSDKGQLQGQGELVEDCLLALSRLDSATAAKTAYQQYLGWVRAGHFSCDNNDNNRGGVGFVSHSYPQFAIQFSGSCFSNGLIEAGQSAMQEALSSSSSFTATGGDGTNSQKAVSETSFLPGVVCATIFQHAPVPEYKSSTGGVAGVYVPAVAPTEVVKKLEQLYEELPQLTAAEVNPVIRMLGKRRLLRQTFELLDAMRACADANNKGKSSVSGTRHSKKFSLYAPFSAIRPDEESLEFLANALVASVEEESTCKAMKDLPPPLKTTPEVLLVGRSNVGKSSLVNFLVNRKAMASVSATPGHTTQFHFFGVNSGRSDLPSFRLVDVPGLGYAEAEDNKVVSWTSLLQRYLAVRDSLGVVLHLVDSRHGLTPIDKSLIDMGVRAAKERQAAASSSSSSSSLFKYCVVLTKCDRAQEKALRATLKDVQESVAGLSDSLGGAEVQIIVSSAVERRGRDDIWKVLQGSLL